MATQEPGERRLAPGIDLVLAELRDLRLEMRADRQRADEDRQRADQDRQRADEAWREERRQAAEERKRADEAWWQEWREEKRRSDERFTGLMSEMKLEFRVAREEAARRDAAMQKAVTGAFKQVHTVGLAIVRTLNRHTQILERIDRKLAVPGNGRRGRDNGRGR